MKPRLVLTTAGVLIGAIVVFAATQQAFRDLEVAVVVGLLQLVAPDAVLGAGSSVVVTPEEGLPFLAIVRPSCSAAGAVIALAVLGSSIARERRLRATAAAILVVTVGNLLRIGGSLGVGVMWGRSSLVLFHDAAGGAFTFLYLIAGFATYLWFTLPREVAT